MGFVLVKVIFGLKRGFVRIWIRGFTRIWEFERKLWKQMSEFKLRYVKVNMWEKFNKVCEWCNDL